ncbi:hypothetical protein [Bdellovibrio bacteriovorus]|uniref:hypothetical protein n=1 Tax=Bdellovibrio bacteriovorus TaxID=959 RepID=UPI0035A8AF07
MSRQKWPKKIISLKNLREIDSISKVSSPILLRKYEMQQARLKKKNQQTPQQKTLFHITEFSVAKKILKEGFRINFCKNKAFGKGIYFCETAQDTLTYSKNDKLKALLVCKVLIGRAHRNSSDVTKTIKNKDGSIYSKPLHMRPKRGFDSMYSNSKTKIWVIPASSRIRPQYLILFK